jgi:hypothetical protein
MDKRKSKIKKSIRQNSGFTIEIDLIDYLEKVRGTFADELELSRLTKSDVVNLALHYIRLKEGEFVSFAEQFTRKNRSANKFKRVS